MVKVANQDTKQELPKWASCYLKQDDLPRIEEAVRKAELATSGEIVPMIVRRSAQTMAPRLILFLVVIILSLLIRDYWWLDWHSFWFDCGIAGIVTGVALLAWRMPLSPVIERTLTLGADRMFHAHARAEIEFYRNHVGNTRHATGILLFVSVVDRTAVVLADKAIAQKLPEHTWDDVLKLLLSGIKGGDMAGGICAAVERCGGILAEHFSREDDDTDELSNRLIIKD